ncbi:hypothetical protein F4809DRAFT_140496 [Biscogniauxia mediterranea]|nr:hypothetical protein F4809DRAFT_140496 [Biscogniauxia mediterranea]
MARLFTAAAFAVAAQAMALDGKLPKPTQTVTPNATFHLPETTEPPSLQELIKRQDGQTVLVGPDNTCGYFDGRIGAVYSCNALGATCAFVTASTLGAVACCSAGQCGVRVGCMDYRDIYRSSSCDNGCFADTYTVKCTNVNYPYCGTVTFFDGIMDYYCDTLSYSTPQQLYTTYDGESDGRSFTPVVVTVSDLTSGTNSDILATGGASASSEPSSSSTSGSSSSNNNDDNNNSGSSSSSPNVGAIVGGVVGGVAVLALLALGIFFIVRHNKKKKNNNPPAAQQPGMQQQTPGPNGPAPGVAAAGGYAQPPYNQPPPQGYPQQGAGYFAPADQKPAGFVAMAPSPPDRPDSTSPVSVSVSRFSDPSHQSMPYPPPQQQPPSTSPTSTLNSSWQQQQQQNQYHTTTAAAAPPPTVHEAGGNVVGQRDYNANHHGQFHELGS